MKFNNDNSQFTLDGQTIKQASSHTVTVDWFMRNMQYISGIIESLYVMNSETNMAPISDWSGEGLEILSDDHFTVLGPQVKLRLDTYYFYRNEDKVFANRSNHFKV